MDYTTAVCLPLMDCQGSQRYSDGGVTCSANSTLLMDVNMQPVTDDEDEIQGRNDPSGTNTAEEWTMIGNCSSSSCSCSSCSSPFWGAECELLVETSSAGSSGDRPHTDNHLSDWEEENRRVVDGECITKIKDDSVTGDSNRATRKATPTQIMPRGLQNLGNTCYFNAALQMLFSLHFFSQDLIQLQDYYHSNNLIKDSYQPAQQPKQPHYKVHIITPQTSEENTITVSEESNYTSGRTSETTMLSTTNNSMLTPNHALNLPLLRAITDLLSKLLNLAKAATPTILNPEQSDAINPQKLKEQIDTVTDLFHGYRQQDAHEFLITLLDLLHDEILHFSKANHSSQENSGGSSSSLNRKEKNNNTHTNPSLPFNEINRKNEDPNNMIVVVDNTAGIEYMESVIVPPQSVIESTMEDLNATTADEDKDYVYIIDNAAARVDEDEEVQSGIHVPPTQQFHMEITVNLTCESCHYTRSHVELYNHLSFEVLPKNTTTLLKDSLMKFFSKDFVDVSCERCDCKRAIQTLQLKKAPRALLIHWNRFTIDFTTDNPKVQKNSSPVEFQEYLSLSTLIMGDDTTNTYRLKSVVHHIGSSVDCGHYITDALYIHHHHPQQQHRKQRQRKKKQWYRFNDSVVVPITWRDVLGSSTTTNGSAYMLLYELEDTSTACTKRKGGWKYLSAPKWWSSKAYRTTMVIA
jgi:ubiquitin C-terminal hydrolase